MMCEEEREQGRRGKKREEKRGMKVPLLFWSDWCVSPTKKISILEMFKTRKKQENPFHAKFFVHRAAIFIGHTN
jgi:hypothetical protein